jgi:phosphohistidine phosphatase
VEPVEELLNEASVKDVLQALRRYPDSSELVLVGHMPSLSDHVAGLIGADNPAGLGLGKGSVACVELPRLRAGDGNLRWLLRQEQMRNLVK